MIQNLINVNICFYSTFTLRSSFSSGREKTFIGTKQNFSSDHNSKMPSGRWNSPVLQLRSASSRQGCKTSNIVITRNSFGQKTQKEQGAFWDTLPLFCFRFRLISWTSSSSSAKVLALGSGTFRITVLFTFVASVIDIDSIRITDSLYPGSSETARAWPGQSCSVLESDAITLP